ncbi:benomyl methotrexate resistance protein [Bipolaris maydis]|nr:benomyl methotrexate resistance protein [Bipolaris maydis]
MDLARHPTVNSAHQGHEDRSSSSFEKRDGYAGDANESVEGVEKEDQEIAERARTQSRRSHDGRSLKTIQSHHSRAGGDGYTCFDPEATSAPGPPTKTTTAGAKTGAVAEQPYLVSWDGDADPENPRSMGKLRRWAIVVICSTSSLCVQLKPDFGASRLVSTLGLSLFVAGLGTGPMILSPLSEFFGRRPIYICSFSFFLIWMIPCAVAQNIQTMLVARFLDGLAGSAFLSVAGGTVGDMFAKHTYHPVLLRRKAIRLRKETGNQEWIAPIEKMDRSIAKTVMWSCIRPFQLLFFEPMCLNLCILSAILLGILYLFFGAFPLVFGNNHGFSLSQTGIAFLGLLVGMVAGVSSDPIWRRVYGRLVRQREEQGGQPGGSEPEFRLASTIVGAWVVPIALFGFGWTTYSSGYLGLLRRVYVFGGSSELSRQAPTSGPEWWVQSVDVGEQYPVYAASALAANSFARSYFAAAFPLFGVQMYNNLGYQWATTVLAFLALAMAPQPASSARKLGPTIALACPRARSLLPPAPTVTSLAPYHNVALPRRAFPARHSKRGRLSATATWLPSPLALTPRRIS